MTPWEKIEVTHWAKLDGNRCNWQWKRDCAGECNWEVKRWAPGKPQPYVSWACEHHAKQWFKTGLTKSILKPLDSSG